MYIIGPMKYLSSLAAIALGFSLISTVGAQTGEVEISVKGSNTSNLKIEATAISTDGSDAETRIETRTEASSNTETRGSGSSDPGSIMPSSEDGSGSRVTSSVNNEISVSSGPIDSSAKIRIINKIITPGTQAASGYLKIGDIKGESTEANASSTGTSTSKGGNVEFEWKVEEGKSAASKPKEIVVVGSKVRGWDPETKAEVLGVAPQDADQVQNETDLAFLLVRAAHDDENIGEVEVNLEGESRVRVEYFQPARLFGFIPVGLAHSIEVRTDIENNDRVKINLPWWHIFAIKEVVVDEEALEEEISLNFEKISASASVESSVRLESRAFQTISNAMKAAHDVAMSSIRNIK